MKLAWIWLILWYSVSIGVGLWGSQDFSLLHTLGGPTQLHPFGFDAFGRDLLFSILGASFKSSLFALAAVVLSVGVGSLLGTVLSVSKSSAHFLGNRILDGFLAFPTLLLALALAAFRGPGWVTLFLALLMGSLPSWIRLVSLRAGETLLEDYVLVSHSMGASSTAIIRTHLVPTVRTLIQVKAPLLFSHALMAEATLTFLGIGAPTGAETWGSLLAQGKDYLIEAPHIAFAAGIPLILTLLALQKVSENW